MVNEMVQRLYIDPGTGSMLFTILIGLVSTLFFFGRRAFVRLQFWLKGGKVTKSAANNEHRQLVIFTDHKRYWNVFKPVCDELEKRGMKATYMTASPDDPALEEHYEHIKAEFIGEGNAVLSTTPGLNVYQWKRSRSVSRYVHILHAVNDTPMYRMYGLDYYDAVLLSGEYQMEQIRKLETMRGQSEKELVMIGLTYMDAMQERWDAMKDTLEKREEKTVLLSPSWGSNSILNRYGGVIIEALLKTRYHIIIRPHPQTMVSEKAMVDKLMEQYPAGERLEWNSDNDNFGVLARSDIMISDFSSIIFDYSLIFDRPIIYADTSYDNSALDCWWMEETMWTFKTLPRIGKELLKEDFPHLDHIIESCLNDPVKKEARRQARKETWAYPGEAAVRCVDYLASVMGGTS